MRRIVAALVVALLAFTLVGCGGGEEEAATTEEAAPAAGAPVEPASGETTMTADKSANDYDDPPVAFPAFEETTTPAVFQDRLDAHRPMLIMFYDSRQTQVTDDLRAEVDAVINQYRGLVDLLTFNVAGTDAEVDAETAVTYASELDIVSTPYILIVDSDGFITWRSKGFAEQGILKREVERVTR